MNCAKKIYNYAFSVLILTLFIFLLINPEIAEKSTFNGLMFSLKVIIPSLFIFTVLSKILFPEILRLSSGKQVSAVLLIAGLLCGFPVGASMGGWLYDEKHITKRQGEYLNTFTNNASISFILSFAGANVLGDLKYGWLIFLFQLAASVFCGIIFKYLMLSKTERKINIPKYDIKSVSFPQAVSSSVEVMANICACIIIFTCLGEIASAVLPDNGIIKTLVKGFLEFSGGIEACRGLDFKNAFFLICLMTGWSGLCVHLQVSSVSSGRFNLKYYYLAKIISSALMGLLAVVYIVCI